jgi:hypothetical protein
MKNGETVAKKTTVKKLAPKKNVTKKGTSKKVEEDKKIKVVDAKGKQKEYATVAEFVNNKEERENARTLARWVKDAVSKNWFDLARYMRKTGLNENGARLQLTMLKEFGFCLIKYERGKNLFKISFNIDEEIALAEQDLRNLEIRIKSAKADIGKLKQRKRDQQKNKK